MSDVTQILRAIETGDAKAAINYCHWSMKNCASSPPTRWPVNLLTRLATHCTRPRSVAAAHRQGGFTVERTHPLFAASAEAMRRILIDNAAQTRLRHGGGQQRVEILEQDIATSKMTNNFWTSTQPWTNWPPKTNKSRTGEAAVFCRPDN